MAIHMQSGRLLAYVRESGRRGAPLDKYFRSSFNRLVNSASIRRQEGESVGKSPGMDGRTFFALLVDGGRWRGGVLRCAIVDIARTQRSLEMFAEIRLSLPECLIEHINLWTRLLTSTAVFSTTLDA